MRDDGCKIDGCRRWHKHHSLNHCSSLADAKGLFGRSAAKSRGSGEEQPLKSVPVQAGKQVRLANPQRYGQTNHTPNLLSCHEIIDLQTAPRLFDALGSSCASNREFTKTESSSCCAARMGMRRTMAYGSARSPRYCAS